MVAIEEFVIGGSYGVSIFSGGEGRIMFVHYSLKYCPSPVQMMKVPEFGPILCFRSILYSIYSAVSMLRGAICRFEVLVPDVYKVFS